MATQPLPLSDIVQVNVSVAAAAIASKSFNQGLIIGSSAAIPSYGANSRVRQYASADAMLTDGFANNSPEYLSALLYFGQDAPPAFVWIGRQDLTALQTVVPHAGSTGNGYVVGDIISPTQAGGSNGALKVTAIGAGGAVTTLQKIAGQQGTGYSVAASLPTTGGSGAGLEVDITAIGETLLDAVQACALASQQWYMFCAPGAADADHLALGNWSTANWQTALYIGASSDAAIEAGTAGNLFLQMQTLKYRALMLFSTTQQGLYPNNAYAAAGVMGQACGLTTLVAGSAYTMNLQPISGVAPEPVNQTDFATIKAANGNVCADIGPLDGYLLGGILSSGEFFDQIVFRAAYCQQLQLNILNQLLAGKVAQNNPAQSTLLHQADLAGGTFQSIGYLGAGTWEGNTIAFANNGSGIQNGESMPNGFKNFSDSYINQALSDKAARKAMPVYACINEAGAVHSVTVQVNVQL